MQGSCIIHRPRSLVPARIGERETRKVADYAQENVEGYEVEKADSSSLTHCFSELIDRVSTPYSVLCSQSI